MPERLNSPTNFFFLVGTGRCGSTLVAEVLARHPDVGFISNLDSYLSVFNPKGRWNNWLYQVTPRSLTQRDRHNTKRSRFRQSHMHFGPSEGWRLLTRYISPTISMPFRDLTADDATPWLRSRCQRFFEQRAQAQGKNLFMHKFTGWPRLGFLHAIFPEARFLHVVRDGRAVANSLIQMPWWYGYLGTANWGFGPLPRGYQRDWENSGRSFAVLAGIEWELLMDAFDSAKNRVPPDRWLEVRYEDIVDNPRAFMERILTFAGLSWTKRFETNFGRHVFGANKNGYLRDLRKKDLEQLDRALECHLQQRGYAVPAPIQSHPLVASAA